MKRKEFIKETAPEFRKPTIEQLETFIKPTWQALIDGAMYCEAQLKQIIKRVKPDVVGLGTRPDPAHARGDRWSRCRRPTMDTLVQ
jgi:hypothetical protein